jgi:hypothetical protein
MHVLACCFTYTIYLKPLHIMKTPLTAFITLAIWGLISYGIASISPIVDIMFIVLIGLASGGIELSFWKPVALSVVLSAALYLAECAAHPDWVGNYRIFAAIVAIQALTFFWIGFSIISYVVNKRLERIEKYHAARRQSDDFLAPQ